MILIGFYVLAVCNVLIFSALCGKVLLLENLQG